MPEETTEAKDLKTQYEHAQRLTKPLEAPGGFNGPPAILVPANWNLKPLPWEPEYPVRIQQSVRLSDHESFCRYVSTFKTPASAIFAEVQDTGGVFTAVLDYHESPNKPAWNSHRAVFSPELSTNWKRWAEQDGEEMNQTQFALFLENNTADIVSPSGADLLQLVNEFEVEGAISFKRVQRLQSGAVKFSFINEQQARAGDFQIPDTFKLNLPLFVGEPAVPLEARLRYRLASNGALTLWFELVNPHLVVRAAIALLVERVANGTGISPYLGKL